ncbi:MAG: hypothetical protein KOO63_05625 [Bacteroidales bacterium]|nr:hypothetical protein [Candidatus Latescibacterota bacterium]
MAWKKIKPEAFRLPNSQHTIKPFASYASGDFKIHLAGDSVAVVFYKTTLKKNSPNVGTVEMCGSLPGILLDKILRDGDLTVPANEIAQKLLTQKG